MTARHVVAVDLGAESGRVVLAGFDGNAVALEVVHRFASAPSVVDGLLRWDVDRIWREVQVGLDAVAATGVTVDSVGVDGWGVDYGFLDQAGRVLDLPVAHRDDRVRGMVDVAAGLVGRDRLYLDTGIQLMEINTVCQLLAEVRSEAGRRRHEAARTMLFVPDLVHHLLCGSIVAERTVATTSAMYDVRAGRWAKDLMTDLGLPTRFLPEVVDAGTDLGPLRDHGDGAFGHTRVVAPASHDTASAVVGVPLTHQDAAYVSSGTWSLVGMERDTPVVDAAALAANLSNEGGVFGTTRLLRNVMGLWLLQECRRQWQREGHGYDYAGLVRLAEREPPATSLVDPDQAEFVAPGDMPGRIRAYLASTGQDVPASVGALARCVLESLALRYRMILDDLAAVTGTAVSAVHVVGGGARNGLLNQLTADVTGLPVHAGPVEATALGNVLVQLGALGELDGLAEMRAVSRASEAQRVVEPRVGVAAEEKYARFRCLVQGQDDE